jgi:hypothetical protein
LIYFMQSVDGGPVKIGFSENVAQRHKELESHYKLNLTVLAVMDGGKEEERGLHDRFSHLRFGRTEQFQPVLELMEFIGKPLFASAVEVIAMPARAQVTILNLKGSLREKDIVDQLSLKTDIAITVIARRGIALWAKSKGLTEYPPEWLKE